MVLRHFHIDAFTLTMRLDDLYSLPRAPPPNDDPSTIRGNVSAKHKEILANILGWKTRPGKKAFGNGAAFKIKLVEADVIENVMGEGSEGTTAREARIAAEVTVEDGMLNGFGACFCLGLATGMNPDGVSTSMEVKWHSPAPVGTILRMVGISLTMTKRSTISRAEIYDKNTGRLLVSLIHSVAPVEHCSKTSIKPSAGQASARL
ncbi:hypothetical protein BXZ70DRAFT_324249 [Cristinia sonorae]|uniref:Thioesterase domain-containing protein n=1 Tax=Cristinia sonorae TaxID=1940300 RepID=A0A8K0UM53_9AGAR|nr:hypothetical protein BXZ70DRAFT_324249 [Cristinia sonorae]